MALSGTGTDLAAQVIAKAIELIEGCAEKCNATIDGKIACIKTGTTTRVAMLRSEKLPITEEEIQEIERKAEESAVMTEQEKNGVTLMLMETRLMLKSLEHHIKQMGESQGS